MDTTSPVWKSFDHPVNVWLPGAKISFNKRTNTKQIFSSWTSSDDPAPGPFSLELDPNSSQLILRWNTSLIYWTSGSWRDHKFSLGYEYNTFFKLKYVDNENESYFIYSAYNPSTMSMFAMKPSGIFDQCTWMKVIKNWEFRSANPRLQCEINAICGSFSICNHKNSDGICKCLDGFCQKLLEPGCSGNDPLQCGNITSYNGERDRFKKIPDVFLSQPSSGSSPVSIAQCESTCLSNCFCTVYAYDNHSCSLWNSELTKLTQPLPGESGREIYIRLAASYNIYTEQNRKNKIPIIVALLGSIAMVIVFLGILPIVFSRRQKQITKKVIEVKDLIMAFLCRYLKIAKQRVSDKLRGVVFVPMFQGSLTQSRDFQEEFSEIQIFLFEMIQAATDEFPAANKLGEGGYGPVYKGKLPNGQDIAVKRLSRISGQGVEQFKNEVTLISKVQHWNLVKLLGYCIRGEDRMLVYEYMPNKSLDAFIFGLLISILATWADTQGYPL